METNRLVRQDFTRLVRDWGWALVPLAMGGRMYLRACRSDVARSRPSNGASSGEGTGRCCPK